MLLDIVLTVCTGYIGGSILSRLLEHPDRHSHQITVLVRSQERSDKFRDLGIHSVTGSLKDLVLLEDLAADADVVISAVRLSIWLIHLSCLLTTGLVILGGLRRS